MRPTCPCSARSARRAATANGQALVERLAEFAPTWVLQLPGLVSPDIDDQLRARSIGATERSHAA